MEQFKEETLSRLSTLEEKTKSHSRRLNNVEESTKELSKLTALMELQVEMNKDQQKQLKDQHDTLIKINGNLDSLNASYTKLDGRVESLENNQSKRKIDLVLFAKDVLFKVVPTLIGAYLIMKFGIK